jgi:hypothetical protein
MSEECKNLLLVLKNQDTFELGTELPKTFS